MDMRWFGLVPVLALVLGCGDMAPAEKAGVVTLATGPIDVPYGEEVQNCFFFEVPSDEPIYVNQIHFAQLEGSHHMNLFRERTIVALDAEPGQAVMGGECWKPGNWKDWPLIANTQNAGDTDWQLPEGVALKLEPHEKIMLQSHYVNATTQHTPEYGSVSIDLHFVPKSAIEYELGTVFATNQDIEICPGEMQKTFLDTCAIAQEHPVTIVAANGHFHSRGRRFTMNAWDDVSGGGDQFYESTQWDNPLFARDLDVHIPQGGGFQWTCEFTVRDDECGDPDNNCCFTFGGKVEYQEHCNSFLYYYPKT
jgi:hypothetical protein